MPRLSVRERQELEKRDAIHLAQPIRVEPQMLRAYTRRMVRLLRDRRSSSPATDAVLFITAVYDRSVAALTPPAATARIACRGSCAYCCVQPVAVTALEVLALSTLLQSRDGVAADVAAAAEKVQGRSFADAWVRCPLLADNMCSVYSQRPLGCHAYVSFNAQDCVKAFVLRDKPAVMSPQTYTETRDACRTVLVAALKICGMPSVLYELNGALAAALAAGDAETRWRQGEDVFADLVPTPVDMTLDSQLARFAESIVPTL